MDEGESFTQLNHGLEVGGLFRGKLPFGVAVHEDLQAAASFGRQFQVAHQLNPTARR